MNTFQFDFVLRLSLTNLVTYFLRLNPIIPKLNLAIVYIPFLHCKTCPLISSSVSLFSQFYILKRLQLAKKL
jgi:hypothetical protein